MEDISYIKENNDYLMVVVDKNIYYISKESQSLEKAITIPLQENEKIIKEQIKDISTWSWEDPDVAFIFETTNKRIITIDLLGNINHYSGYTNMVSGPEQYVLLDSKDRLWIIYIDNAKNLVFEEVEGSYLKNRNQHLFGITFEGNYYYEVYNDGFINVYYFSVQSGLNKTNTRENNLNLQEGETLINLFGQYAYTSNDRMIDINNPRRYHDYKNSLLENEKIAYAVYVEWHQIVFVSNKNRVFLDYQNEPVFTLKLNERILYYYEEKIITNYGLYYIDWEQGTWNFRNDFLDENETIVLFCYNYIVTSFDRAIFIGGAIEHSFKSITFKQYQLDEIIYALFNSSPELPRYGDNFEGWYIGEYFSKEFDKVTNANYVILYPKWK